MDVVPHPALEVVVAHESVHGVPEDLVVSRVVQQL